MKLERKLAVILRMTGLVLAALGGLIYVVDAAQMQGVPQAIGAAFGSYVMVLGWYVAATMPIVLIDIHDKINKD